MENFEKYISDEENKEIEEMEKEKIEKSDEYKERDIIKEESPEEKAEKIAEIGKTIDDLAEEERQRQIEESREDQKEDIRNLYR
jgi:hypothetical protein